MMADMNSHTGASADFAALSPDRILSAVEDHLGVFLDGVITPYNSYINRVFGVVDEDERQYIVKFYRPGRWSREAVAAEHAFLADCARAEIPVVPPLPGKRGGYGGRDVAGGHQTAGAADAAGDAIGDTIGNAEGLLFAVFPRVRARTFDIYGDGDWLRVGSLVGRLHRAAGQKTAPARLRCTPEDTATRSLARFREEGLVHPDCAPDFFGVADETLGIIGPLFDALEPAAFRRIHGDCHRGNILEGADGALTLIDFDDMMNGPAIQDLWLLLPGPLSESMREMNLLIEGYEQFLDFDRRSLALVEPLRFMRHLYFLSWCAIQRSDAGFAERNPGWGTRPFWIRETEDLAAQLGRIREDVHGMP